MKAIRFVLFLLLSVTIVSCSKDRLTDPDVEVQYFIWKGLNKFYLWQHNVPDLSDRRFSSESQLNLFLHNYSDPKELFESLLYQRARVDRWSVIVKDYNDLEQSFQGSTKTNGMEFGLVKLKNRARILGYVRYVVPGTDSDKKGLKRGMIFTKVNGQPLTAQNYRGLLFSENASSYTLGLASFQGQNKIIEGLSSVDLTKQDHRENPVYISKVFKKGSKTIGYLMYNGFVSNFDKQLNDAFAKFKSENITDLIVDLRYNPGGALRSANYLASMITGQFKGQLFVENTWNERVEEAAKKNADFGHNLFTDRIQHDNINESINSLNLTKAYFITTNSSASASEALIMGLKPYIDVKIIGTKTTGKNVGSVTLYDSPKNNFSKKGANPNHKWAMQPIVFEVTNKNGKSSKGGIPPTIRLVENFLNMGVLGDEKEPLLARAISEITSSPVLQGISSRNLPMALDLNGSMEIDNSKLHTPITDDMYIELEHDIKAK